MAKQTFQIGELVNVLGESRPILGTVVEASAPLGFFEYGVLDVTTGEKYKLTRLRLESADLETIEIFNGDLQRFISLADDNMGMDTDVTVTNKTESGAEQVVPAGVDLTAADPPAVKSRFLHVTENELEDIQRASKSAKTHKMTRWGVKVFRGKCTA